MGKTMKETIRQIAIFLGGLFVIAGGVNLTVAATNPISRSLGSIALACIVTGSVITELRREKRGR